MPTIDQFVNNIDNTLTQRGYLIMSLGCEVLEDNSKIFFNSAIDAETEEHIEYSFLATHLLGSVINFNWVRFGNPHDEQTPSELVASLKAGNQLLLPTTPEKAADIFAEAFHTLGISPKK